jgi:gluconolactonase
MKLLSLLSATMILVSGVASADMQVVATDVIGVEGPQIVGSDLYYVSWAKETVNKWDGKNNSVVKDFPGCGPTGLTLTPSKTLFVACSADPGTIMEIDLKGNKIGQWDADKQGNKLVGGVNDLVTARSGAVYATLWGQATKVPSKVSGKIIMFSPQSKTWSVVAEHINYANGIGLSPDNKTLYVSAEVGNVVYKFPVNKDGTLGDMENFAVLGALSPTQYTDPWTGPDGIEVDHDGNVYVAQWGGGKILKISSTGELLKAIEVPGSSGTTNIAFSDDDKTMFITAVDDSSASIATGKIFKVEKQ